MSREPLSGITLGPAASRLHRVREDELLRNSFYLTVTTGTIAAFGFAFWLLNSRLYTAGQIGAATTLISGASLIANISLFGFNTTFIRFLPTSQQRDEEINTGLVIVFCTALLAAALYVLLIPWIAPRLAFMRGSFAFAGGFVALTAFWAVNLVTDSVFIAFRRAQYNVLVDGVIQGVVKLALAALLVGLGAYGVFMSSGLAAAAAVAASILFMVRTVGYQPRLSLSLRVLRRSWDYSAAAYAANLLILGPVLVTPLIVLNVRGPRQAGYYFMAFQLASLLYAMGYAVSQSLFAEASQAGADLHALVLRSGKLLARLCLPLAVLVALTAQWLLLVFGRAYSEHAATALVVLALSTPSVALCTVAGTVLKIEKQLKAVVFTAAVYAATIVGLALLWASRGLPWVALAWLIGNTAAGLLGAAIATARLRHHRSPQ